MQLDEAVEAALDDLGGGGALRRARELDDLVGARGLVCGLGLGLAAALGRAARRPATDPQPDERVRGTRRRRLTGVQREKLPQHGGQVLALHDRVAEAVLEQELRALEPRGELFPRGLLDHARACEGDERPGLRQGDVAFHGEARRDAAGRGVGQHTYIKKPRLRVAAHRRGHLGHLHKGGHALLHARSARHGEAHDGQAGLGRLLEHAADLLADDRAHRPHHEAGVHKEERALAPADTPAAADHGVVLARGLAGRLELLGVAREAEEIGRAQPGVPLLEAAGIHGHAHAGTAGNAQVLAAARADLEVLAELLLVDGAAAARALDEHVAGGELGADLGHGPLERVHRMADPIAQHRCAPSGSCGSCRRGTPRCRGSAAGGRCSPGRPRSRAHPRPSASSSRRRRAWASRR